MDTPKGGPRRSRTSLTPTEYHTGPGKSRPFSPINWTEPGSPQGGAEPQGWKPHAPRSPQRGRRGGGAQGRNPESLLYERPHGTVRAFPGTKTANRSGKAKTHRSGGGCPRRRKFPIFQPPGAPTPHDFPPTIWHHPQKKGAVAKGIGPQEMGDRGTMIPGPKWTQNRGRTTPQPLFSGEDGGPLAGRSWGPFSGPPLFKFGALVQRPHHMGCAARRRGKPAPRHTPSGGPRYRATTARRGLPRFQPQPGRIARRTPQPDHHGTAGVRAAGAARMACGGRWEPDPLIWGSTTHRGTL